MFANVQNGEKRRQLTPIGHRTLWVAFLLLVSCCGLKPAQGQVQFEVSFDSVFSKDSLSGDIYLILSSPNHGEPRRQMNQWPMRGYVFRQSIKSLRPGETVILDRHSLAFPQKMSAVPGGVYSVQAILDISKTEPDFASAVGNGYSPSRRIDFDSQSKERHVFTISEAMTNGRLDDRGRIAYRRVESRLVGREVGDRSFVEIGVVFPENYDRYETKRRYPVQFWIPGQGETIRGVLKYFQHRGIYASRHGEAGFIGNSVLILIDSKARNGHHLWMDSKKNGPFRRAFFDEIMPYLESEFPISKERHERSLLGFGKGGLAALHLFMDERAQFEDVWAFSPDPVDFHDFFGLNLYEPKGLNAFYNADKSLRTLVREQGKQAVAFKTQSDFEAVIGQGNLFQSYEAAYGQHPSRDSHRPLFNADTGLVNQKVASDWCKRDYGAMLKKRWTKEGESLSRRIHILVGDQDNYYLARPVLRLKDELEKLGPRPDFEVLAGVDHPGINAADIHRSVQKRIARRLKRAARKPTVTLTR